MIFQAMELIRQNLSAFIAASGGLFAVSEPVILGNVAFVTDNTTALSINEAEKIYMSLVNVEEEASLKNLSAVRQSDIRPLSYENPPLYINLYLLFTASHRDYSIAIRNLALVLNFFQGNRSFSVAGTPVAAQGEFASLGEKENNIRINLDLMSLTFEQVNHLWGSLGGRQLPFLLFKARQVEIDIDRMMKGGGLISEIQIN